MALPTPVAAAAEVAWHGVKRTFSVICTLAVIGLIAWALYVTIVKPHTNPTKTTSQQAESITNIEETNHYGIFHLKLGPIDFGL